MLSSFSRVRLFVTPWTVARQAPLSRDYPGENTGVGCHALLQELFLTQGLNMHPCISSIAGGFFTTEPLGKQMLRLGCNYLLKLLEVGI